MWYPYHQDKNAPFARLPRNPVIVISFKEAHSLGRLHAFRPVRDAPNRTRLAPQSTQCTHTERAFSALKLNAHAHTLAHAAFALPLDNNTNTHTHKSHTHTLRMKRTTKLKLFHITMLFYYRI